MKSATKKQWRTEPRSNATLESSSPQPEVEYNSRSIEETPETPALRPSLGALLVEAEIATDEQVKNAAAEGLRTGERLGEIVVRKGWATDEQIGQLLAEQWQLRFLKADALSIDPLAVHKLPIAVARRLGAVPIGFDTRGVLLAIAEPSEDLFAAVQEEVSSASYVVVARSALDSLLGSRLFADAAAAQGVDPLSAEPVVVSDEAEFVDTDEEEDTPTFEVDDEVEVENEQVVEVEAEVELFDEVEAEAETTPEIEAELVVEDAAEVQAPATVTVLPNAGPVTVADVDAALKSIGSASSELQAIHNEVMALGESLAQTRVQLAQRETDVAERDAQLEEAEAAQQRDAETIRTLESELAERSDLFETLRKQVAGLSETLVAGSTK